MQRRKTLMFLLGFPNNNYVFGLWDEVYQANACTIVRSLLTSAGPPVQYGV
jgi:hypothetical protein